MSCTKDSSGTLQHHIIAQDITASVTISSPGKAPILDGVLLTAVMHDDADRINTIALSDYDFKHRVNMKTAESLEGVQFTYETLLYKAAYYGKTKALEKLLSLKANPNILARNGWSALFIASKKGYTEIVKALIKAKTNVTYKNKNSMTSLNIAAYGGHIDIPVSYPYLKISMIWIRVFRWSLKVPF